MEHTACTCYADLPPSPLCPQHGHEDVRSGLYFTDPTVRDQIDREMLATVRLGDD